MPDRVQRRAIASLTSVIIATLVLAGGSSSIAQRDTPSEARLEREIFDLVNRHRTARALPVLALDPRISSGARRHSAAMAAGSRPFGHDGFPERIAALRRVMSCSSGAENISSSLGYRDPAPEVVRKWLESSGHRTNIEGRYDVTGVGVARSPTGKLYFTQIFVAR